MNIPSTSASTAAISQQFCVRWNSHLGSLGAAFPQLLAGQRFVDVTLACEGHQVHCHRLVLAACSTYFESLLGENPCKHPIIILPRDIRLWEIQALVDFMYKGEVNVSQAGLTDLLKCAEILQIRGLCGTDAALNLNQLTQMGIGSSNITKMPTTNLTPNHSSNANLNFHLNSTNLDCATTTSSKTNSTLPTVMAADLPQPSLLSTALTATTSFSGMSLVQNILNKTSANSANTSAQQNIPSTNFHSSINETNSTTSLSNLLTTNSGHSSQTVPNNILSTAVTTTETTGRRRSERKSNHQQKIDENDDLILDSSNDDLDIKCEDLIIDEDELLKEHNVTTDDCDDEDMDDSEKMNEEDGFHNIPNRTQQQSSPTMQHTDETDEENQFSLSYSNQEPSKLNKTDTNKLATHQLAILAATPSTSTAISSHLQLNCGSIRVKSNENLFENYDKQIKIASAGTISADQIDGGGGGGAGASSKFVLNDYQLITTKKSVTPQILPASLKFNRNTMEICLKPAASKNKKTIHYSMQKDGELYRSNDKPGNNNGSGNSSDYENIICAPNFDEITGGYDDADDNDEDTNHYYEDIDNVQNDCDNDDYDFPTIIDEYEDQLQNDDSGLVLPPPLIPFGCQNNNQKVLDNCQDYVMMTPSETKPFMYQVTSSPRTYTNKTFKYTTGRSVPYSTATTNTNNNIIMTQREKNEILPAKNQTLEKMLANGGPPPVAFVLRNPRGNQPRTYTTDALWAALMDVKSGESIYRASQIHKVPRKTLRNWMKRWDIKSAYPMPRQLQQAAERKKLIRDSLMTSTVTIATDPNGMVSAAMQNTPDRNETALNNTFSVKLH